MKFIIFYGKRLVLTNYIHIYFHRALYLILQCIFGWDWSFTKFITSEFFIKWTHFFFIKSTKIRIFYQYGYMEITTFCDPWSFPKAAFEVQREGSINYKNKALLYFFCPTFNMKRCIFLVLSLKCPKHKGVSPFHFALSGSRAQSRKETLSSAGIRFFGRRFSFPVGRGVHTWFFERLEREKLWGKHRLLSKKALPLADTVGQVRLAAWNHV